MNKEVRDRLILPVILPLGALGVIAVVTVGVSRVLLAVPNAVAVAVALMVALNILGAAAMVALRPRLRPVDFTALLGVVAIPILAGGALAFGVIQIGDDDHERPAIQEEEISADNLAFDKNELKFVTGIPILLRFTNNEVVPHNVAVYGTEQEMSAQTNPLFQGEIFGGPATREYRLGALQPGTYFFHCDLHPNMRGTVVVEEAPPGDAEPPVEEISADQVRFDREELVLPAGVESIISFTNRERLPHNFAIYQSGEAAADPGSALLSGDIFQGPASREHRWRPPASGEYFFQCDVHPTTMSGTIRVE